MRKMSARISIVILSLSIIIVFVEFFLRQFSPVYLAGQVEAYQYDQELGVRLKDGIHFLNTTDYQQEIYTNEIGTVNFQRSFDAYETLIFAIGDSHTH